MRSGRWSLEKPRRPRVWPPSPPGLDPGDRGVHEHDIERGQQVAPVSKQLLLQNILHAARRKRRRAVLLVCGRPRIKSGASHGAIEMAPFEVLDAVDAIILAPAVGGAVQAAAKEAVQHGQKRRSLEREAMLAHARQALDGLPAAGLLPHPLESERRPDASRRRCLRLARLSESSTIALSAKRAPERSSRSNCALACNSSIRPSAAITCWRTAAPSRRLWTICK